MIVYPYLVAEYIQYEDITPFQPLQLACTIRDLEAAESIHGKLTAVVHYWLVYQLDNEYIILSFVLEADVAVNSNIVLPTHRQWEGGGQPRLC